jgi:hypothetical protein
MLVIKSNPVMSRSIVIYDVGKLKIKHVNAEEFIRQNKRRCFDAHL